MLTELQVQILNRISPGEPAWCFSPSAYAEKSKLQALLGDEFLKQVRGKTVLDFGCGPGAEAIDLAHFGARRVIGLDIRDDLLNTARERAQAAGVGDICCFTRQTHEPVDLVISIDAFEHFDDPAGILRIMDSLLKPEGEVMISFGPTWYHPLGGHLFSVFPWAHLLFSERALLRWRSGFRSDGATRFREVEGGLNQMTIRRFEKIVEMSPFRFVEFEAVPIRKLRLFHNRLTREFTSAIVRCRLVKRSNPCLS